MQPKLIFGCPIRPGTDVALMLGWTRYIIEKDLYDHEFVMKWTNLPYLVNAETKRLVRASDLDAAGDAKTFVVWDAKPILPTNQVPWDDAWILCLTANLNGRA